MNRLVRTMIGLIIFGLICVMVVISGIFIETGNWKSLIIVAFLALITILLSYWVVEGWREDD